MDIHVSHAHQDKLLAQTTLRPATPQLVPETNKLELLLTTFHVVLVRLANGQYILLTLRELNAFLDHVLFATIAPRDNQTTDTHA
jgi:hypothetical protein